MPFGGKPVCASCKTTSSPVWRKSEAGNVVSCNACWLKVVNPTDDEDKDGDKNSSASGSGTDPKSGVRTRNGGHGSQFVGSLRKSARLKPSKHRFQAPKAMATKGKSRRVVFKKNPIKAASSVSTVVTSDYMFYDGIYYQVGDIVSVMDHSGGLYFAQLRGFMQDQYCEKSAVITWLLPSIGGPTDHFDPATYILGPEEDFPRKMECFEFVCHAPSEYFKSKTCPYPTAPTKPELGYVWTGHRKEIATIPTSEEIYGLKSADVAKEPKKTREYRSKRKQDTQEKEIKKEKV